MKVVGLDVGYGNVKMYADGGERRIFPTMISSDTTGLLDEKGRIRFNGSEFVIGREGKDMRSDDFPLTDEYKALVLYSLSLLFPNESEGVVALALGVPPKLRSTKVREEIRKRFRRRFEFEVEGRKFKLTIPEVQVYLQGWGGYRDYIYTLELKKVKSHVVPAIYSDWGFYTIDTIIVTERMGELKPELPHRPTLSKGVSRLFEIYSSLLNDRGEYIEDLRRAEKLFRAGKYPQERKKALDIWKSDILSTILNEYSREVPDLDRIVIFGGGANLVEHDFKLRWGDRDILVVKTDEFANARGYYKSLKRELLKASAPVRR
ncbi:ParM/StbA family protein [Hydrogenivirga sp.]